MSQGNDCLLLETEGPIEIMGPKVVSLVGGGISIYVRSLKVEKPRKALVKIYADGKELRLPIDVD